MVTIRDRETQKEERAGARLERGLQFGSTGTGIWEAGQMQILGCCEGQPKKET